MGLHQIPPPLTHVDYGEGQLQAAGSREEPRGAARSSCHLQIHLRCSYTPSCRIWPVGLKQEAGEAVNGRRCLPANAPWKWNALVSNVAQKRCKSACHPVLFLLILLSLRLPSNMQPRKKNTSQTEIKSHLRLRATSSVTAAPRQPQRNLKPPRPRTGTGTGTGTAEAVAVWSLTARCRQI